MLQSVRGHLFGVITTCPKWSRSLKWSAEVNSHATHLELGDLVPELLHLGPHGAHQVGLDQVLGEGEQTPGLQKRFQVFNKVPPCQFKGKKKPFSSVAGFYLCKLLEIFGQTALCLKVSQVLKV